jgi:hypothetical protein
MCWGFIVDAGLQYRFPNFGNASFIAYVKPFFRTPRKDKKGRIIDEMATPEKPVHLKPTSNKSKIRPNSTSTSSASSKAVSAARKNSSKALASKNSTSSSTFAHVNSTPTSTAASPYSDRRSRTTSGASNHSSFSSFSVTNAMHMSTTPGRLSPVSFTTTSTAAPSDTSGTNSKKQRHVIMLPLKTNSRQEPSLHEHNNPFPIFSTTTTKTTTTASASSPILVNTSQHNHANIIFSSTRHMHSKIYIKLQNPNPKDTLFIIKPAGNVELDGESVNLKSGSSNTSSVFQFSQYRGTLKGFEEVDLVVGFRGVAPGVYYQNFKVFANGQSVGMSLRQDWCK